MKKILVILGHPRSDSLCGSLAAEYVRGAEENGIEVRFIKLGEMQFDPVLRFANPKKQTLETDLLKAQEYIQWANHLVFVYPTWWLGMPALLKGFFDRAFIGGFAYQYEKGSPLPKKLLKGKTARLMVTMDAPPVYHYLSYLAAGHFVMKKGILSFCGIGPTSVSNFGSVKYSSEAKRTRWLKEAHQMGRMGA